MRLVRLAGDGLRVLWRPRLLVAVLAVALGAATGGRLLAAGDMPAGLALTLGLVQALPLVVAMYRPMTGFWLSLAAGMLVSEVARAGGDGPVWAEPSLLAHLGVLALIGLQARPRVLVALWLLTLAAGAILVQRMPGMDASADLGEMTILSAVVLAAAAALGGRREAQRRLAEQQRISDDERAGGPCSRSGPGSPASCTTWSPPHVGDRHPGRGRPYRVPNPPRGARLQLRDHLGQRHRGAVGAAARARRRRAAGDPAPQPDLGRLEELVAGSRRPA